MSYVNLLANDKNIIIYRPELNKVTGSPLATILLCQVMYWSSKFHHKEFYKNIYKPNSKAKGKNQKSWSGELGFNNYQTRKAFDILQEKKLVSIRVENSSHNTYVKLNRDNLEYELKRIYTDTEQENRAVLQGDKREQLPFSKVETPPFLKVTFGPSSKVTNGPSSKVTFRTTTETTHRLHREPNRDSENCLLRQIEEKNKNVRSDVLIKENFKILSNDQKEIVMKTLKDYMIKFPECKNQPMFKKGVVLNAIKKCQSEVNLIQPDLI